MKTFRIVEVIVHLVDAENEDEAMDLIDDRTIVDTYIEDIIEEG